MLIDLDLGKSFDIVETKYGKEANKWSKRFCLKVLVGWAWLVVASELVLDVCAPSRQNLQGNIKHTCIKIN